MPMYRMAPFFPQARALFVPSGPSGTVHSLAGDAAAAASAAAQLAIEKAMAAAAAGAGTAAADLLEPRRGLRGCQLRR